MNPYQPPISIFAANAERQLARGCCPICRSNLAQLLDGTNRRTATCPQCRTELRKVFPLWVNLCTVLSYLSGFLLFTLVRRLDQLEKPSDIWDVSFYAITLLVIVPHFVSAFLYRRNYRLVFRS